MPRFSICISTYNDAPYISSCFDSVLSQSFGDFELIVVNDASTDETSNIISSYASSDARIVVIDNPLNSGVHLGRLTAVERASGDCLLFLDSDDRLLPGCLEFLNSYISDNDCDYLHFGTSVVGSGCVSPDMVEGTLEQANCTLDASSADDLMHYCYDYDGGYKLDWHVWQRVYKMSLAKEAFNLMKKARMGRGQDAYEHFVLASLAEKPAFVNDFIGYEYQYGRGITSNEGLSIESWLSNSESYYQCAQFCFEYAGDEPCLAKAADGLRRKLLEGLVNDWRHRLDADLSIELLDDIAQKFGRIDVAAHLMRIVRDDAYKLWDSGNCLTGEETFLFWYEAAKEMAGNDAACSSIYQGYYRSAKLHIGDLRKRTMLATYGDQDIRIFVSTHKPVDLFDSRILQPVQVGCALRPERYDWALHDDEGDNISELNPMYCELTTQYWAWKNVDAPYIGFCHYRRYFDFSDTEHEENPYGEVMDGRICAAAQGEYRLDDEGIARAVLGADVVTTAVQDIRSYLGRDATLRSQYAAADHLYVEDLDRAVGILVSRHPEYEEDARRFLDGHSGCFCNMFIMRRELFRDYCAWLFPILEEFVSSTDMSRYSREGLRTPGHLAERLLNIYLLHLQRERPGLRVKRLQCVHFEHPDFHPEPKMPAARGDSKPVIPVVFASDNNYVPMLTTTVYSAVKNASADYRYDVTVLHRDISGENQRIMRSFFGAFPHVSLTFCDVSQIVEEYDLSTNNPHISIETYYRFLIQRLLPFYDKVLYLDSDLIVEGDISELFSVELGDNLLAAAHDIDFVANVNMKRGDRHEYARSVLGMDDPYSYFQAGVLVLNTRAMREAYTIEQWLGFASDDRFIYNDQDVLNAHCEGRVTYLDYDWNVMIDCRGRVGNVFSFAPAAMLDAYLDSRSHEKIVHYAGVEKPWNYEGCDRSEIYWAYVRETPFYEKLLMRSSAFGRGSFIRNIWRRHIFSPSDQLRRLVDPILPIGSHRREFVKRIGRKLAGN